jgi:hypothetical protein
MKRQARLRWLLVLVSGIGLALALGQTGARATPPPGLLIAGSVQDRQGQPVEGAQVSLSSAQRSAPVAQAVTQPDGRYVLSLPPNIPDMLIVHIERAHFAAARIELDAAAIQSLRNGEPVALPDTTLLRQVTLAFWIATLVFAGVLVLIASGRLHNTLAALVGAMLVLGIGYLGHPLSENLFIFDFPGALRYVDWNVIFLVMGMMIVIA